MQVSPRYLEYYGTTAVDLAVDVERAAAALERAVAAAVAGGLDGFDDYLSTAEIREMAERFIAQPYAPVLP